MRVAGNIVVVDEAHNLLDTIGALHSHDASLAMVRATGCALTVADATVGGAAECILR